jgi:hypothetical protein
VGQLQKENADLLLQVEQLLVKERQLETRHIQRQQITDGIVGARLQLV